MPCDYLVVVVNDYRNFEAELFNARRNRVDRVFVLSRVSFVRLQVADFYVNDLHCFPQRLALGCLGFRASNRQEHHQHRHNKRYNKSFHLSQNSSMRGCRLFPCARQYNGAQRLARRLSAVLTQTQSPVRLDEAFAVGCNFPMIVLYHEKSVIYYPHLRVGYKRLNFCAHL